MEMSGGGPVMDALRTPSQNPKVFVYGITQNASGLGKYDPQSCTTDVASMAVLLKNVPKPFRTEYSGGPGQTIHHKFVVVDFNDKKPFVFTGSSNLSDGGERENGDNLLAIEDSAVAIIYGVEGIRLVDHYHFRNKMQKSGPNELKLQDKDEQGKPWWYLAYQPDNRAYQTRLLLCKPVL
jgi:phosphatidylserine/phosphatidylglycerophosphate/cardiolipin synthase-like enzyme